MPGTAPVGTHGPAAAVARLAPALLPGVAAAVAALASGGAAPRGFHTFRADAAGLAVAIAVGAFTGGPLARRALCVALAAAGLAVAHAVVAADRGGADGGAWRIAALAAGCALAAGGLADVGRAIGGPRAATAVVAACVPWAACGALWWADAFAELAPVERRGALRDAVLAVDPYTAAAYGAAGLDRLHLPAAYEGTTIAAGAVRVPTAERVATTWAAVGLLCGAAARLAGRRRGRRPEEDDDARASADAAARGAPSVAESVR